MGLTPSTLTVTSDYAYVSRRWVQPKVTSARAGAFTVHVDGKRVGVVPALGALSIEVEPGMHTLRVGLRWFRSRPVELMAPADDLRFTATIPQSLASFLRLAFKPRSAIVLRRVQRI